MITIRHYASSDEQACVALFMGNTPTFFSGEDLADFLGYLRWPGVTILVAEGNEGLVAVGGCYVRIEAGGRVEGRLAWGMVARSWHRRGVGTALLRERLDRLAGQGASTVSVRTSPESRGFFERSGFQLKRIVHDGFGQGRDLVELELMLRKSASQDFLVR